MKLYHGTEKKFSNLVMSIPNQIDRTKGGGELGMGFYAGDNLAMAAIFAKGKYGNSNASVIEFDIDKTEFSKLDMKLVKTRKTVFDIWTKILESKKRHKYLYNTDVVVAPFATIEVAIQYKFESEKAEKFINKMNKSLIL